MTVATSTLLGRPLWYELLTTDMKAAEAFYRPVVGWTTAPFQGAAHPYTIFHRGGETAVAGLMTQATRHEHAAVLGDVRGRSNAGRGRRQNQTARRE